MGNKIYVIILLGLWPLKGRSQTTDTNITMDLIETTGAAALSNTNLGKIENSMELASFLAKLKKLQNEKTGQLNIVHIGDSHIQADVMTAEIRRNLQKHFGNAGRGFVFPHNLVKTNGATDFRFSSNVAWKSYRNIYPEQVVEIGLSGILLSTKSQKLVLQFNAKEAANGFNTIKIITPDNRNLFEIATSKQQVMVKSATPKILVHIIKKGETISEIAVKYSLSVTQVKKTNGLKSDRITFGKTLKIPTNEMKEVSRSESSFQSIPLLTGKNFHYYHSNEVLKKIYLLPNKGQEHYLLSGAVLENDKPGLLYHNLGVNGAKFSDYNKYPLFFEQLKVLQPDLIVLSFGTNESYGKSTNAEFMHQLVLFIDTIRETNAGTPILVITPPPSFLAHHKLNTIVDGYCTEMQKAAVKNHYAFYDLHASVGGMRGVEQNFKNGIIAADRVHYTVKGYQMQGKLVSDEIMQSFLNYNK